MVNENKLLYSDHRIEVGMEKRVESQRKVLKKGLERYRHFGGRQGIKTFFIPKT